MSTNTNTTSPLPPGVPTSTMRASHIRNLFFWQRTEKISDGTVFITGAASGIGKTLSLIYASRGCKLALCDYNKDGLLETLKECRTIRKQVRPSQYLGFGPSAGNITNGEATLDGDEFIVGMAFDVSKEEECKRWIDTAVEKFEYINVLILCAGIGAHNVFSETKDLSIFRRCIEINYYGYLYCLHAAFPHLQRTNGILTMITSFSGEVGLPFRSAYCASKFAVTGMAESIRSEDPGFDIVIACPPTVNTNLRKNSGLTDASLKEKHDTTENTGMTVEDCATCIVDATDRRLRKAFFPLSSAIASYARPLIPDQIDQKIWAKARL